VISPRLRAALGDPAVGAVLVYFVGIAIRLKYSIDLHPPTAFVHSDMSLYVDLARYFVKTGGPLIPPDVTYPLGFPAFLALLLSGGGSLARAGYVHMLVGCLVPPAVGLLGGAAFGRRTGLLALAFASLYFPFIEYGALFLTEIHSTFWMALAFAGFFGAIRARRRAVSLALAAAGGVALSLAIAMKNVALPAALVFFAVEGLALLLARPTAGAPSPSRWSRLRPWLLRGTLVAVGAAPLFTTQAVICTRANRGSFCFAGNKPAADFLLGHYGRIADIEWVGFEGGHSFRFGSPGVLLRHYDEHKRVPWTIWDNRANAAEAWRWIRAHPLDAITLSLDHVYDTFFGTSMWPTFNHGTWPWADLSQYVFVLLLFIPTLLACARIVRSGGMRGFLTSRAALVLSPLLGLTVTVAIATGEVRYRIPFDIFFIAVAGAFVSGELRGKDPSAPARAPQPIPRD
jgi:hypothetical protein